MFRKILLAICLLFTIISLRAQSWEVGAGVGASGYMGDINPRDFYRFTDVAYTAQVKRNFDGYWSAKLNFMKGNIWGSDAQSKNVDQQKRNLSFFSPLTEVSMQVEFNFFNYLPGISRARVSPYLFAGVGGVKFNPKAQRPVLLAGDNTIYELKTLKTEEQDKPYKTLALTVPYGIGLKYNIKGYWNLIGEIGYRTAYTDYLDDVSRNYPNNLANIGNALSPIYDPVRYQLSNPTSDDSYAGTQRGDYRKTDTYMFAGLSLTFTFVSRKCPVAGN